MDLVRINLDDFIKYSSELKRLREQNTELQKRMTELVEENRLLKSKYEDWKNIFRFLDDDFSYIVEDIDYFLSLLESTLKSKLLKPKIYFQYFQHRSITLTWEDKYTSISLEFLFSKVVWSYTRDNILIQRDFLLETSGEIPHNVLAYLERLAKYSP